MPSSQQTYRAEGISCANCTKTFESNIKRINGVENPMLICRIKS
ncbi:cation transporter [Virgibacillus sp. L01]